MNYDDEKTKKKENSSSLEEVYPFGNSKIIKLQQLSSNQSYYPILKKKIMPYSFWVEQGSLNSSFQASYLNNDTSKLLRFEQLIKNEYVKHSNNQQIIQEREKLINKIIFELSKYPSQLLQEQIKRQNLSNQSQRQSKQTKSSTSQQKPELKQNVSKYKTKQKSFINQNQNQQQDEKQWIQLIRQLKNDDDSYSILLQQLSQASKQNESITMTEIKSLIQEIQEESNNLSVSFITEQKSQETANSSFNKQSNKYKKLQKYEEEIIIKERKFGKKSKQALIAKSKIAHFYFQFGNFNQSTSYSSQILETILNQQGKLLEDSEKYINLLLEVNTSYVSRCFYQQAVQISRLALFISEFYLKSFLIDYDYQTQEEKLNEIFKNLKNINSYANLLFTYGSCLFRKGRQNYPQALKYLTFSQQIYQFILQKNNTIFGKLLTSIGVVYHQSYRPDKSFQYSSKCKQFSQNCLKEQPDNQDHLNNLKNSLHNMGNFLLDQGRFSQSKNSYLRSIQICKKLKGSNHPDYANSQRSLIKFYIDKKNYCKALEYIIKTTNITRKLGPFHPRYALNLVMLPRYYSQLQNFEYNLFYTIKIRDIYEESLKNGGAFNKSAEQDVNELLKNNSKRISQNTKLTWIATGQFKLIYRQILMDLKSLLLEKSRLKRYILQNKRRYVSSMANRRGNQVLVSQFTQMIANSTTATSLFHEKILYKILKRFKYSDQQIILPQKTTLKNILKQQNLKKVIYLY